MKKFLFVHVLFLLTSIMFISCDEDDETLSISHYQEMYTAVYDYLMEHSFSEESGFVDGDDQLDYGDTTGWGGAYFFTLETQGIASENDKFMARELAARERFLVEDVRDSGGILGYMTNDKTLELAEAFIGIISSYIGGMATNDPYYDDTAKLFYDEFSIIFSPAMIDTLMTMNLPYYGPTTIIGGISSLLLQYPISFPDGAYVTTIYDTALSSMEYLDEIVFDTTKNNYRYWTTEGHDFEYVYSTASTVLGVFRLFEITKNQEYLDKALDIMEGLELLYSEEYDGYFSAENSSEYFDIYEELEQPQYTEEYMPLSTSNYLIYSNLTAYHYTRDEVYLTRAETIFDFVENNLYDGNGRIEHHLEFGELSGTEHYCSGCNVHMLYNILLYNMIRAGIDII